MKLMDDYTAQASLVRYMYDSWAPRYDEEIAGRFVYESARMVASTVLEFAPQEASPRILDLATGTGGVLKTLKGHFGGATLTGLDVSYRMLQSAQEKYLTRDLHQCDIETDVWPVKNESVDILTCAGALGMVGNLNHVLQEASRTMKDGAIASMSFLISHTYPENEPCEASIFCRQPDEVVNDVTQHGFTLLKPVQQFVGYSGKKFHENHGLIAFTKG